MEKISLTHKDIEKLFGEPLSDYVKNKIDSFKLVYSPLTDEERDQVYIKIINTLLDPFLVYSGPHRLKQWEKGWGENYNEMGSKKVFDAVNPRYFGKYNVTRLNQQFVKAVSPDYERNTTYITVNYILDKYARDVDSIYEFGCGTGHNLFIAHEINPKANLVGLDWAKSSQKIIKKIAESGVIKNITGYNFDFFKPNTKIKIADNSAVFTVAALEQIGKNYKKFVSYLLKNKPKICIHMEPIAELLDETKLIDNLAIKYFRKRHYLNGYLDYLRNLEKQGKIKILAAKRTYIGSMFVEGHSLIIWKPIK